MYTNSIYGTLYIIKTATDFYYSRCATKYLFEKFRAEGNKKPAPSVTDTLEELWQSCGIFLKARRLFIHAQYFWFSLLQYASRTFLALHCDGFSPVSSPTCRTYLLPLCANDKNCSRGVSHLSMESSSLCHVKRKTFWLSIELWTSNRFSRGIFGPDNSTSIMFKIILNWAR